MRQGGEFDGLSTRNCYPTGTEQFREDVKNIPRGGVYIFFFGGGDLLFSLKKGQHGGSVHIFHQIWPNYRVNLLIFRFFWGGVGTFSLNKMKTF